MFFIPTVYRMFSNKKLVFALNELVESKSKWNEWDPMESKFPIPFNTGSDFLSQKIL